MLGRYAKNMKPQSFQNRLRDSIKTALDEAEAKNLVVLPAVHNPELVDSLVSSVMESYAGEVISPEELTGISNVLYEAVADPKFFDWEMPTKCGYKSNEIRVITDKLRQSIEI